MLPLVLPAALLAPAPASRLPADWAWAPAAPFGGDGVLEVYGTPERPGPRGTIYDYMNGGGELYLSHGLLELRHGRWRDPAGATITLDLFTFASEAQARSALADPQVCPPGSRLRTRGPHAARTHAFPPEFFLYLACGPHLVNLHTSDDRLADRLLREAWRLAEALSRRPSHGTP